METKVLTVGADHIDADRMQEAARMIQGGGLVAFPTETVYGLGADATNPVAAGKIYQAKGRPSDNPLIVHIGDISGLAEIAEDLPQTAYDLAEAFWPGPLTLIVKKNKRIPEATTGGLDTVAVRFPNHPVALALIRTSGCMIAAPSANASGRPSPTRASHVMEDLGGRIEMIIDGGQVGIGIESTIVDLTGEVPQILRPGYVTPDMIRRVTGEVRIDPGIDGDHAGIRPKAPGMRYRHYAPRGDLKVVQGPAEQVVAEINQRVADDEAKGWSAGVIATRESRESYPRGRVLSIGSRSDEDTIAAGLYDILRKFDDEGIQRIYSECFDTPRMGQAIMNRLLKAAGHQVIQVS